VVVAVLAELSVLAVGVLVDFAQMFLGNHLVVVQPLSHH
jgi:hypothetical protein